MSTTPAPRRVPGHVPAHAGRARGHAGPGAAGERRVRHQAREALAVMAFSAATSGAFAVALLLLTRLGHQG